MGQDHHGDNPHVEVVQQAECQLILSSTEWLWRRKALWSRKAPATDHQPPNPQACIQPRHEVFTVHELGWSHLVAMWERRRCSGEANQEHLGGCGQNGNNATGCLWLTNLERIPSPHAGSHTSILLQQPREAIDSVVLDRMSLEVVS